MTAIQGSLLFGAGAIALALIWFIAKAMAGHWLAHKIFAAMARRRREKKSTRINKEKK
jgi:arginine exporter protein ArgO